MINIDELVSTLTKKIKSSDKVFLMPHIFADVDTLSACYAVGYIAKTYNKHVYLIFDDDINTLDKSAIFVIKIIKEYIAFISLDKYNNIKKDNDLIIACDVNKKDLVPVKNLDKENTIVIDHHEVDRNEINSNYKYIDKNASSASEISYNILKLMNLKPTQDLSNCLLAGIYLDTNKFSVINNYKMLNVASELLANGADYKIVKSIFISDFLSDRKVQNLINKANIYGNIAICASNDNTIYTRAELARVADYLIDFDFDASFAIGHVDNNLIGISARSNGNINVQEIMKKFNGGGTITSSAARISDLSIEEINSKLKNILNIDKNKSLKYTKNNN